MNQSLFRPEALKSESNHISGKVLLAQPFRFRMMALAFTAAVAAILLFLVFGDYARRQVSGGVVTSATGSVRVLSRFSGSIDKLVTVEGQLVQAGEMLIQISNQRVSDGNENIDEQLEAQLRASLSEYDSKLINESDNQTLELKRLQQQVKATQEDLIKLRQQLQTEQQKLQLVESRKSDFERLRANGFVSEAQNKDQQQLWLEARSKVDELQRVIAQQQAQHGDFKLQLQQLPSQQLSRLADLRTQRAELSQRLIEVDARRAFSLVAPVSGRITALQVKPGQMVTPQTVLMSIVPEHAEFEVELFVPTRAIGFVHEGQTVHLRYQAFPYQRYGLYEGQIKTIAKAILMPQEIVSAVPLPNEPVYRVVVRLNQQHVQAYGKQFDLQSGMLLDADIVLDRRPIWQWLLEPVLSLRGRV